MLNALQIAAELDRWQKAQPWYRKIRRPWKALLPTDREWVVWLRRRK